MLYVSGGWNGYTHWMALTPYPASNDDFENPSILASADGLEWVVPAGLTNPIDPEPAPGHNSDTDIVLDASNVMWCFYRDVQGSTETLMVRSSSDGVTWSAEQSLITSTSEGLLSPAVVWDGSQWVMFTIDHKVAPNVCRRRTASSPDGPWSDPSAVTMSAPSGRELWHLDVIRSGGTFHSLLTTSSDDSGSASKNHLARSTDGLTWSVGDVIIDAGPAGSWDDDLIYRGSMLVDGTDYRVWYSARKSTNVWRVGYTTIPTSEAPPLP